MSDGHALFCIFADDVRQEINGKQFIVGMYQGGMNVANALPTTLPQLYIVAHLIAPEDSAAIDHLKFTAELDGTTLVDLEPPVEVLKAAAEKALLEQKTGTPAVIQITVGLQPFHIEKAGRIFPKIVINRSTVVIGNSLQITHATA